jgi:hypothetical protein
MVVSLMISDAHLHFVVPRLSGSSQEVLGKELTLLIELVRGALSTHRNLSNIIRETELGTHVVNQDVNGISVPCYQLCRVEPLLPLLNAPSQIAFERFLAPQALAGV